MLTAAAESTSAAAAPMLPVPVIPGVSLHCRCPMWTALAEVAHAVDELGGDGVTIETNAGGRYLGDPAFAPLWTELERRRTPVFVHPTSPPHAGAIALGRPRPRLEFLFDTARAGSDLAFTGTLRRYPADPVDLHPRRRRAAAGGRTSGAVPHRVGRERGRPDGPRAGRDLWFDIAGTSFPHQVPAFERAFGTRRLLYGSDFCWTRSALSWRPSTRPSN
ncbi:amidohydrolase family protein [Amycolatopsis sp. NPDC005961]|uniref:amidohydrolase family protein n=1 Tax=Amycolatopsis sp. NPDC005961 TaxID=3156720 RepID=UPI00340723A5